MWNDLRLAVRVLARERTFTVTAVTALAIGIAGTTTMFSVIYGAYLRDLPFSHPDRIVSIGTRDVERGRDAIDNMSFPDLRDLQLSARLFDGIVAADEDSMDLADDTRATERVVGSWVSAGTFALLGHRPAIGRDFTPEDDVPGAEPVVILGDAIWKRRFNGDPAIVGRRVRLDGSGAIVIGVMPEGFGFPHRSDVWMPLAARGGEGREDRGARTIDVFGRMAPGVTLEQAEADIGRVLARLAREFPATNSKVGAVVRPFRDLTTSGPIRIVFTALMGAVTFLLLVACANVGNLLLARGASRGPEVAVRLSLGASRGQVVRQLLAESFVLAFIAGSAGLWLAALGLGAFQRSATGTGAPYWVQFSFFELPIFAFVAAVCLGTTILCGLAPALQTLNAGVAGALGQGARTIAGADRARRWTDTFVVAQVALTLTMLTTAGLWMRNVHAISSRLNVGVDTASLVAAEISLSARAYPNEDARRGFHHRLHERLTALPGMQAGITSAAPGRGAARRRVSVDGPALGGDGLHDVSTVAVGPGYLETLGVSPRSGRLLTAADENASNLHAVVNERFAALLFPESDAVGRTIWLEPASPGAAAEPLTIVGIVPNVRQASPRQESIDIRSAEPVVYRPYMASPPPAATIIVRSNAGPGAVADVLRSALGAIDSDVPLMSVRPLDEAVREELGILALFGSMFGLFAVVALSLAAVGLYAVTAHAAARRTRELAIRLALGARVRHVCWMVARRAAGQVAIGLALGIAGALAAGRLLQTGFAGLDGRDPITLGVVPLLMVLVALAACIPPAARAVRLDAASVLRTE